MICITTADTQTALDKPVLARRPSTTNKKLRYREEHSASIVLSWCTL